MHPIRADADEVVASDVAWPRYETPDDLATIEAVPLAERGLPDSTYALLRRAGSRWPDRTAVTVIPNGERWEHPARRTFGQLLADVHRTANALRDLGVGRTDSVALISPNCDELLTATLAAQLAGIAAPINAGLSGEHVAELIARSGAKVLIAASPELDPASWRIAEELAGAKVIDTILLLLPTGESVCAPARSAVGDVSVSYLREVAHGYDESAFLGAPPEPGDLAAMFHTGGTTGTPKLAAHTHANEVVDAWMVGCSSAFGDETVILAALPLFHVNALVVTLLAPLFRGAHAVWAGPQGYRDTALLRDFWRVVAHFGVTTMSAVPTVYAALAQCPVDADISGVRSAVVGASSLPAAVRKDFESHTGVPLVEGYGLTEATCASALNFPGYPRPGSVGQRLPYQRIRTVRISDDGAWENLPTGEVGNVVIGGPTVFPGYVMGRDAQGHMLDGRGKLVDGWLDTGDLGWVDTDGFLHLIGRAKDLIIRGGHNIDPAVIEGALLEHPDVTGAAAVGRPDPHSGEVPVAYVTVAEGSTATEGELRGWATEKVIERAAAPKSVTILDALPTTAVGKPSKLPLRADAAQRALRGPLTRIQGVVDVQADASDGSIVVTATVDPSTDTGAVAAELDRYTVAWKILEQPGGRHDDTLL